jgi:hypothetical protein
METGSNISSVAGIRSFLAGGESRIEIGDLTKTIHHGLGQIPAWVEITQKTEISTGIPEILSSATDFLSYLCDDTTIQISMPVTQTKPVYFSWSAGK